MQRQSDQLDMRGLLQMARQYLQVRSVRRALLVGLLSVVVLVWILSTRGPKATSAVGCKSKIAQILWRKELERKKYLEGIGEDVFSIEDRYFAFVTTAQRMCYDQVHIGPSEDGGWEVCLDPRFRFKKNCLVYSFGVGHDFRFEKGIEDMLGCEVHAFDPSMGIESHQYSAKGHFYNIGIDSEDSWAVGNTWKMHRLGTIMKMLNHERKDIDYMKLDVEFSEWPAIYDMLQTGVIHQVRQLVVEVHTPEMDIHTHPDHLCTWSSRDTLAAMFQIMIDLHHAGFHIYYSRTNYRTLFKSGLTGRERYCCYDIHMVNMNHKANGWVAPPGEN